MHPLQIEILTKLLKSNGLRFSQIRPDDVGNDRFYYHLQYLISQSLVNKSDGIYSLTDLGNKFVAETFPLDEKGRKQFTYKFNVLVIIRRKSKGKQEIIMHQRTRNPFYGKFSIPGGNIYKGEPLLVAAERIAFEDAGLKCTFKLIGFTRNIIFSGKDSIFTDILLPLVLSETVHGNLANLTEKGNYLWMDIDEAVRKESKSQTVVKILKTLQHSPNSNLPLFYTEEIQDYNEQVKSS